MDISFDTIIYIILGLIFVIAQVAKNKRKKVQAQSADNEDDSVPRPPRAQTILEQMLGIPEEKAVVENPVENIPPHLVDPEPSFSQPRPGNSIENTVNEVIIDRSKPIRNVPSGKIKTKIRRNTNFNLKQAVIYKTILERKKY